jgi:hypothetical protein
MNCEKCQALVHDYLDGHLNERECAALKMHFENCSPCAVYHADLMAILDCCEDVYEHPDAPPNAQALWLRISNLIESEQSALIIKETEQLAPAAGVYNRFFNRSWQFSFQQIASGVAGVIVITALLTVVGLQQQNLAPAPSTVLTSNAGTGSLVQYLGFNATSSKPQTQNVGLQNRLKNQQVAIEYWNQRVEQRKRQWNNHLREAFDRNLRELDTVVAEYEQQLQRNPHDDVSEEMLDSALNDKMQLLREFAEL